MQSLGAASLKEIFGSHRTFGNLIATNNHVTFTNDHVLAHWDKMIGGFTGLSVSNNNLTLAANGASKGDLTIKLRNHAGVFRTTSFEKFRDSW